MGYLITQILIYLILAAVIGFLIAWVLRGSRLGARIEELENEVWRLRSEVPSAPEPVRAPESVPAPEPVRAPEPVHAPKPAMSAAPPAPAADPAPPAAVAAAPAAAPSAPEPSASSAPKPLTLSAPQGEADDLKRIKGIGPKIEGILHTLGIYHYHQIASWTPDNVAWVNDQLSFKGRIEREEWIEQAKTLTA